MRIAGVLLAVMILALNACAFSRGTLGDELKTETINSIKKGITTRADVIAQLGAPDRILQLNGRDLFQYYRYDAKVGSLLLIW